MRWILPVLVALGACGDDGVKTSDASVDTQMDAPIDGKDPNNPLTLADTGLCLDAACTQISPDVVAYEPRYQLWSDSATKRRWIYLPPGTKIDTTDMDYWDFPVGTKLWKEFTRGTTRVETRLIMRVANTGATSDWFYAPYVWNQAQDATTLEVAGVIDANGTQHDVPSRFQCKGCHENLKPTRVLGFSAIQLDWNNPDATQLDLEQLVTNQLLTVNPTSAGGVHTPGDPYYPLPAGQYDAPALGYLHANCGHCHNPHSGVHDMVSMELRLTVGSLGSVSTTPAYLTAVGQPTMTSGATNTTIITKGNCDTSALIERFESTNVTLHMPALGSEMMDPAGDTALRDWITNLQ